MKKAIRNIIIAFLVVLALFIYYYITLPAINVHSVGTGFLTVE